VSAASAPFLGRTEKKQNFGRTSGSEDKLCGAESVGVVDGDREPDEAEEKIEHQDEEREAEHALVPPRGEVIDRDRHEQHEFGDGPDERTPFDIIVPNAAGKVDLPHGKLRHDVIRRCLLPIRQNTIFFIFVQIRGERVRSIGLCNLPGSFQR
jgi:hypothetical protein